MKALEQIEQERRDFIKSLSIVELKGYVDNLLKNYYQSYIGNDEKALKENINEITIFIDDFKSIYPNIDNYINQRLVLISNQCFRRIFQYDLDMFSPNDVDLVDHSSRDLFDEKLMMVIIIESEFMNIHEIASFLDKLPDLNDDHDLNENCLKEVSDFLLDVKAGKYDQCLLLYEEEEE